MVNWSTNPKNIATWLGVLLLAVACNGEPPQDDPPQDDTSSDTPRGQVTVWMGVGERESDEGCYFLGEMMSDSKGCSIVRVDWDLDAEALVQQQTAIENPATSNGAWQPNVSMDGTRLAYSHSSTEGVQIRIVELGDSELGLGDVQGNGDAKISAWPNFDAAGNLRLSRPDTTPMCKPEMTDCKMIEFWKKTYELTPGQTGETELNRTGFSFEDTYAHPTRPEIVAGHGKYLPELLDEFPVCAGETDPTPCLELHGSPMPIVMNTETGQVWVLELESTEEPFGAAGSPFQLEGCAHVAWTPDGTELLCTEQGTDLAGYPQSRLYSFAFDVDAPPTTGTVATPSEPLFPHAVAEDLFEIPDGLNCDIFHHKYAEFCGRPDVVVATLGCADCEGKTPCPLRTDDTTVDVTLIADRVYLIDISDPSAPKYHDLTQAVEADRGRTANDLTSFTATCTR